MEELMLATGSVENVVPVHLLADLSWIEKFQISKDERPCTDKKEDQEEKVGIYLTDGMAYTIGVNKSYEDLTGNMEEEVMGMHMQVLQDAGYFDQSATLLVLEHRTPLTINQTIPRSGKKVIVTGNPIFDYHGNIAFVISTIQPWFPPEKAEGRSEPLPCVLPTLPGVVASSRIMQQVLIRASRIAAFDSTVLICGETGVGKEVVAKLIHRMSLRSAKPFINVNLAAIPDELFESELFGYRGGAFTGALKTGKSGLVDAAVGGTIFLDEIAELSLSSQTKLLRLLQEKEVTPLGSVTAQKVDVRFISATNRNLAEMVRSGSFREDLYYRLNVAPIYIPPLRERKEDIINLAQYFLAEFSRRYNIAKHFNPRALQVLIDYNWPGNVRELQNIIERIIVLYPQREITGEHFLQELALKATHPVEKIPPSLRHNLHEEVATFEKNILMETLGHCGGDLQKAAVILGIHRTTLFRKLRKYALL
ncbi:MAG: sigma 54-interacting transcriptional regulator [Peptococcaceae bacterium]|jgi:transcriptional regulator with PAS, ATPase and Fis domain|nr:sigma 54-interacting transcriptional regulator [Peptococcaceae bacterium]